MALSWSNDHIGPDGAHRGATVRSCWRSSRATTRATPPPARARCPTTSRARRRPLRGLRVGVPENYFFHGRDRRDGGRRCGGRLGARHAGRAGRGRAPAGSQDDGRRVQRLISRCEGAAVHARPLPRAAGGAQRVRARPARAGLGIPPIDYLQALRLRARLARAFFGRSSGEVDALVAPVIPEPAPALSSRSAARAEIVAQARTLLPAHAPVQWTRDCPRYRCRAASPSRGPAARVPDRRAAVRGGHGPPSRPQIEAGLTAARAARLKPAA